MVTKIGKEIVDIVKIEKELVGVMKAGNDIIYKYVSPVTTFTFTRTIDRNWGETFGSGGASPFNEFTYKGQTWRLYQIVPQVGGSIANAQRAIGDGFIQIRNRDINRGSMTVEMLPDRIIITRSEWLGSPWTFSRTTRFGDVGNGSTARVGAGYAPVGRTPPAQPSLANISTGDEFTITLEWDS